MPQEKTFLEGRRRYVVGLLLFAAGFINYMDRAALGVAAPFITRELSISPSHMGIVFSVFFIGYTLFAFVGGQLADRLGPRAVYTWAAGLWSLFCALTGLATSQMQLVATRALFGFAEGPMNSTSNRAITNWFPRQERGRSLGFVFSGQTLGTAAAAPVVGLMSLAYGWRMSFFVIGGLGLVWICAWRAFMTDHPVQPKDVAQRARRRLDEVPDTGEDVLPLRRYLLHKEILAAGFAMFAMNYTMYVFLSWLPTYLTSSLHMSVKEMAAMGSIPWACGFLGYAGGGVVADALYLRMHDKLLARKILIAGPLALSGGCLFLVTNVSSSGLGLAFIAAATLLLTCSVQTLWATISELVPESRVGGVGGFIHLLSNLSGIIGPTATGLAIQYLGGFSSAFGTAAVLAIAGAAAVTLLIRKNSGSDRTSQHLQEAFR